MATISERIIEGMRLRDLRQVDVIERTGINKGAMSSYISGRYQPKQNNIYLIAKALNVNEAWLMGADVPMQRVNNATDDALLSLTPPDPEPQVLRSDEQLLLRNYNQLNVSGKEKALDYVEDLAGNVKYTSDDTGQLLTGEREIG